MSSRLHPMPILPSSFHPPAFLRNGHVQTILPAMLRRRQNVPFKRERMELEDGDFLDLDWMRTGQDRLAILSHGLEGCSDDGCIHGTAKVLCAVGWDVLAWNLRGCGKEPNRLLRSYHCGETGDLGTVIRYVWQTKSLGKLNCFPGSWRQAGRFGHSANSTTATRRRSMGFGMRRSIGNGRVPGST